MHDMPSVTLRQQEKANPKTGQELEVLGKCAAKRYVNGECETLNAAVVETVKQAGLSPEQVRRVIEFANTDAYLVEFNKEGSHHKYVEFHGGPADPAEVLRDLNDGGGGTVFDRGLSDYSLEPTMPKTAELMDKNLDVVHDALQAMQTLEKAAARFGQPTMMDIGADMQGDAMKAYSLPGYGSMGFDPFGERQKMLQVRMLSAATGKKPVVVKHANAMMDPGLEYSQPTLSDETRGLLGGTGGENASAAPPLEDPNAAPQEAGAPEGYDPMPEHMKLMQQHMKLMQQRSGGAAQPQPKMASLDFNPAETMLRDAFHVEEQEYDYAEPLQDSLEMRDKLAGAAEHITAEVFGLEGQLHDRLEDVYQEVKTAALEGVELGQILAAWQEIVPDAEYVKVAFSHIGPRLAEEGVFRGLDAVGASLEKTAHAGMVNTEHPLVGSMSAFCLTLEKLAELRLAQEELIENRGSLEEFLQKMANIQSLKAGGGLVGALRRGAREAGGHTTKGVKELGELLLGTNRNVDEVAKYLGKAVTHSPEIAAGAGGLMVAHKAKQHGMVPGTRENAYRKQMRAARRAQRFGGY
jgi:hypothetical protein